VSDVAKIAAGLTKAEAEALLNTPRKDAGALPDAEWEPYGRILGFEPVIAGVYWDEATGERGVCAMGIGLAVRTHLQEQSK